MKRLILVGVVVATAAGLSAPALAADRGSGTAHVVRGAVGGAAAPAGRAAGSKILPRQSVVGGTSGPDVRLPNVLHDGNIATWTTAGQVFSTLTEADAGSFVVRRGSSNLPFFGELRWTAFFPAEEVTLTESVTRATQRLGNGHTAVVVTGPDIVPVNTAVAALPRDMLRSLGINAPVLPEGVVGYLAIRGPQSLCDALGITCATEFNVPAGTWLPGTQIPAVAIPYVN